MVHVFPIADPGLGNTSYLVDLGDGSGLVVDPQRDPRRYVEAAEHRRLLIRHVAETHLHADFVSGARELVALGASLVAPRRSRLAHPHRAVGEGDELKLGDLDLLVMETPGHTPEHVAYVLSDGSKPQIVFTGGSVMVGGVARPDLISPELTVPLTHRAYQSARRLLSTLPDQVAVWPTHGGGSLCSSPGASPSGGSTIGSERRTHPAIVAAEEEAFVNELLAGLGSYPPYFRRLREVNRLGPETFGVALPLLSRLSVEDLDSHTVVDARPIDRFAAGHIPGSISIELRDQFGTWLGWLFEPDTGIVFVLDPDQDERELVRHALNVGLEGLLGRVSIADWLAAGRVPATIDLVPADHIETGAPILDVRQRSEWEAGHVSGAAHIELGELASDPAATEPGAVVHCGHGQRAMTAASLVARTGKTPPAVTAADHSEIARIVARS